MGSKPSSFYVRYVHSYTHAAIRCTENTLTIEIIVIWRKVHTHLHIPKKDALLC